MLLWITLLCLLLITIATSDFAAPELLADYGPNTPLQPYEDAWQDKDSPRKPHLICDLLVARDPSPSTVDLQGRAPPNDLHFIPGPLMTTDALRQDIAFPGGSRLIRGLPTTRGVSPGVLVNFDTDVTLQPLEDHLPSENSSEGSHLIRGLLWPRAACPTGYGQCSNDATKLVSSRSSNR